MDQKGAIMPLVLVLCLVLAGMVGHQAVLLTFEREGLEAQRMFMVANLLLDKGEEKWWEAYKDDRTSDNGFWEFEEGTVYYRLSPANGSDYEVVTLNAEVDGGGNVHHYYYVKKADPENEDKFSD
ncbi:hypothetical protein HUG15_10180 [Salicibibacter cibarius]|uniref:Type II secretion system protein n=1 Tax=Salicibibacter cibarius TaxID=2743000 RepID=A0A7T6Z336_9BACI|nr:hypothetical protein [Salicibibacter cibarius]QQK75893.1 hypothetical protein HUG15_10180 [Salicibibacter cibarius]